MKAILLVCVLFYSLSVTAQENIHNRKANTLVDFSSIISYLELIDEDTEQESTISLMGFTPGYLVLVKSEDQMRDITSEKMNLLDLAFKGLNINSTASDLFGKEVLITTEDQSYWLPIQKSLEPYWSTSIEESGYCLIYVRSFGITATENSDQYLITINSFNGNYYDGLWEEALNSFNSGDPENGINIINKMIELDPSDGRNYSVIGYYYYDTGFPSDQLLLSKADSLYSKAIELSPEYGYAYYQRALVKIQLGEYHEAWKNIDKARQLGEQGIEEHILSNLEQKLPYNEYLKAVN